jgi:2-desacetyl-2-hydroxyethyl bacteriochlorophyllide A dehydrogenase
LKSARAVWFERPGVASLRVEALDELGSDDVLVRTLFTGVSAGTERLVLTGQVPADARAAMAGPAMRGDFGFPLSYGYAAVGIIEEAGAGVALTDPRARFFALYPHHDRFVVPFASLRPLPDGTPAERLVLAANLETAINVVWDADVSIGERVVVSGLGVVGLLVVWICARSGARSIAAIDPDPERCALAERLGATKTARASSDAPIEAADVSIEASGAPEALGDVVARAGPEARVIVASFYGDRAVPLRLGGRFHPHRVSIRSSQVASVATRRRDRFTTARRWELVADLLREGASLDALVAPPVPLTRAPEVYAELAAGERWMPPQRVFDASH